MGKNKSNKNSVIRIIISNFDNEGIKEFKVLYSKQGGVDTFCVTTKRDVENKKILFEEITPKKREKEDKFYPIISEDKTEIEITKCIREKRVRKYKVYGNLHKENNQVIQLHIEDLLNEKTEKRKVTSMTERKLLSAELMKKYEEISKIEENECSEENIDSQKIYKIKRFLEYRSNMLIYFQFINDFLVKETGETEIWKFVKDRTDPQDKNKDMPNNEIYKKDERLDKISSNILEKCLIKGIKNHNNRIKKLKEKNLEKAKFKQNDTINQLEEISIDKDSLKSDLEKIIRLFMSFRHKLMHYNYDFFEKLFDGKDANVEFEKDNFKPLAEVLNLNIFKELSKVKDLKEDNKTNYLMDDSEIRILGKNNNAKKIYGVYNKICNRKNGFNKFINSLFITDGIEDEDFKQKIREDFHNRISYLKDSMEKHNSAEKKLLESMKKELEEKQEILTLVKDPYVWDIHQSREYKVLYNERKNYVEKNSELIAVGRNDANKIAITKNNKKLLELKNKMEKITKLNSKMRLEYKMQVAFGFLFVNFTNVEKIYDIKAKKKIDKNNLKIKQFLNYFESSSEEKILEFIEKKDFYLKAPRESFANKFPINFDLGAIEKDLEEINFLSSISEEDSLAKFYVLMYLLIPIEMRGDFLGFVKKHYYDIKNIDFIEIKENVKTEDEKKEDKFFQNLRLFEKNSKKFEIISYEMIEFNNLKNDFPKIYEKFGLDSSEIIVKQESKHIFDKNIILPLMKYYQIIFKLLNDIELHALFKMVERRGLVNFEEAINKSLNNGNINFVRILNQARIDKNPQNKYDIRNAIAHLNYSNLFLEPLLNNESLLWKIDNIILKMKEKELDEIDLGYDFINDFYMKKEQLLFFLKQTEVEAKTDSNRENKIKEHCKLLNTHNLSNLSKKIEDEEKLDMDSLKQILKRYNELIEIDKETDLSNNLNIDNLEVIYFVKKVNSKTKKTKLISQMSAKEKEEHKDNILGKIQKDASDLLGIYKKQLVYEIKSKLINLFTKSEKRYVNFVLHKVNEPKDKILTLEFIESCSKNWFENDFITEYQENLEHNKNIKKELKSLTGMECLIDNYKIIVKNSEGIDIIKRNKNVASHWKNRIRIVYGQNESL